MNILNDFLMTYRNNQVEFSKKDLVLFAVAAIREATRLELDSTGQPGKAAIEFLLNMKYEVIENRRLQTHAKDLLLAELDSVINKMVIKYHIRKQGNKFYFKESLAIVEPTVIGPVGSDLLADLYAANTELEVLRIQLARVNLNSSDCLRLRAAILAQEDKIKAIKLAITKKKYFSHTDDLNSYNTMYRRSIGEHITHKRK